MPANTKRLEHFWGGVRHERSIVYGFHWKVFNMSMAFLRKFSKYTIPFLWLTYMTNHKSSTLSHCIVSVRPCTFTWLDLRVRAISIPKHWSWMQNEKLTRAIIISQRITFARRCRPEEQDSWQRGILVVICILQRKIRSRGVGEWICGGLKNILIEDVYI